MQRLRVGAGLTDVVLEWIASFLSERIVFRTVYSASVGDVVLLEEASCDAGDDGYVALHDPYGAVEHRLFAQAVYRPSLRRTC